MINYEQISKTNMSKPLRKKEKSVKVRIVLPLGLY